MVLHALTIFLGAFLLFQVQPQIARFILPWFGGGPGVWTSCMLFFQVVLLFGYAYAHGITRTSTSTQKTVHLFLLVGSLFFLPAIPDELWKPEGQESPVWRILGLLVVTIAVPYFLLAANGPLLQHWLARRRGEAPYRLFALSNAGSLLALISYPIIVEPYLALQTQAWLWSGLYVLFALGCAGCSLLGGAERPREETSVEPGAGPTRVDRLMWLGLSAFPAVMLLASTSQICQEVAVIPFLWVLPLSVYLITFIIAFDHDRWYHRGIFGTLLVAGISSIVVCLSRGLEVPLVWQVVGYTLGLFTCCMSCHGELARLRPEARNLTLFYLHVAAGGALGGLLVTFVAIPFFSHYWELHIGVVACGLLVAVGYWRDPESSIAGGRQPWTWAFVICFGIAIVTALCIQAFDRDGYMLERSRNFYGVLSVVEKVYRDEEERHDPEKAWHCVVLYHGRIEHGFQYKSPERSIEPTSYYGTTSGAGYALRWHPAHFQDDKNLDVGVVGLGAGTLAVYVGHEDSIRFYEINPEVKRVADTHFEYLQAARDRGVDVQIVLGDARVQLEREVEEGGHPGLDVLLVDAFSSDAIPMHLLTRECFATYWERLKPDGVLAVHVSNRYLNLQPVVRGLAEEAGYEAVEISSDLDDRFVYENTWILVTRNELFLDQLEVEGCIRDWTDDGPDPLIWTDDYGSLWRLLW